MFTCKFGTKLVIPSVVQRPKTNLIDLTYTASAPFYSEVHMNWLEEFLIRQPNNNQHQLGTFIFALTSFVKLCS